ncbi:MAG: hypothetical protein DRJ03_21780 [Chloroflexi bacterium]|nr:MAG: hypothetical protein DRJ03_21780 [Chloroflexota bacterium]
MRRLDVILIVLLCASLAFNAVLAYIHYVVQVQNVFTIGADYMCEVRVSTWNSQEKLDEFGLEAGQLLGRGIGANLYWSEMIGFSKWSPIINITNTSPDKVENITWVAVNLPQGATLEAFFADENGSTGVQWISGSAGAVTLGIGESFNVVFQLQCASDMPDGTYSFDIDIRCEDA